MRKVGFILVVITLLVFALVYANTASTTSITNTKSSQKKPEKSVYGTPTNSAQKSEEEKKLVEKKNFWLGKKEANAHSKKLFKEDLKRIKQNKENILSLSFLMSLIQTSPGARQISEWMSKSLGIDEYNLAKKWGITDSEIVTIATNPAAAFCKNKASGVMIMDKQLNFLSSGSNHPSFNGRGYAYVYGSRIISDKCDWETKFNIDGEKPCWIRKGENEAVGYLYKISFSFQHPYSEKEIEDMNDNKITQLGMEKNGTIYMRVVLNSIGEGDRNLIYPQKLFGRIRTLGPGDSETETISFYSKRYFDKVYLEFVRPDGIRNYFKYLGSPFIPADPLNKKCSDDEPYGCFKELLPEGYSSFEYIPQVSSSAQESSFDETITSNIGTTHISSGTGSTNVGNMGNAGGWF